MYRILVSLSMALSLQVMAQLTDSFSDGNLSGNPLWMGDTSLFKVHSGNLHLAAPPVSGKAWISTLSKAVYASQWELSVQLDFNPSSSNYVKIFLISDRADLSGFLNGYYLMIGNTGDEVSLFRQTGTSSAKIIDGRNGILDLSNIRINIRINTDENGRWNLYTKMDKEETWTLEGTVRDDLHKQGSSFGIMCVYTSTRSDKFHFDDIIVNGFPWPDREAPKLLSTEIRSEEEVILRFSEAVIAAGTNQFIITESGYMISSIQFIEESVSLGIQTLKENTPIHLNIKSLSDRAGNSISDTTILLLYRRPYQAKEHDIIFNEIMADPAPSVGLQELEYIEFFNRTDRYIDLGNWKLTDEKSSVLLPSLLLGPRRFVVFYPETNSVLPVQGISLPGIPSLNNSADRLFLFSDSSVLIDSLNYKVGWHAVEGKEEGGWSLERIDPEAHCDPEKNWTSSIHPGGGTPGKENSVLASRPDLFPPVVSDAEVTNDSIVVFTFNEPLEANAENSIQLKIQPDPGKINLISQPNRNQISVGFDEKFKKKIKYHVQISGIRDCPGNSINAESGKVTFFSPEKPDSLDIVLNEILFNPLPGGTDFIEIFNRSDKYFRLRNWSLTNDFSTNRKEIDLIPPVSLSPGGYLVFTDNAEVLKNFHPNTPDSVIVQAELPSMPDDQGSVGIMDSDFKMLDLFNYSSHFHLPMIRNDEGISIERINPDAATQSEDNWRSAALGISTPGRRNSVFIKGLLAESGVQVIPEIFSLSSPAAFTTVQFNLNENGFYGSVAVFEMDGRMVLELANNVNLRSAGFLRWDGNRSDGRPVSPGFYLMVTDIYNDSGYWRRYRSRIVVLK